MKVLWFEVSTPSGYIDTGRVIGGWQDSLEQIVKQYHEIELYIAFETLAGSKEKQVNGVTYIPLPTSYSFLERQRGNFTWKVNENKLISKCIDVVKKVQPDIIHVFGCEWPFGLIAEHTNIPVVIHIQGSIIPYNNALYAPRYNEYTEVCAAGLNFRRQFHLWRNRKKDASRLDMEKRIWQCVDNYMGRTKWDLALTRILKPDANYFHVDEALRPVFLSSETRWKVPTDNKIKLTTTGIHNFWKGPDMLLKTAHILKGMGIDFEWYVAGRMHEGIKEIVESKEHLRFADNNVTFIGFTTPDRLCNILCSSTIYVHTAYIENSPNSICEAQILGVPVVSTNVGGISTLVRNGIDGILVPANDPWQMAYNIISLAKDKQRMQQMSKSTRESALKRHNPENIFKQLMACYTSLIKP